MAHIEYTDKKLAKKALDSWTGRAIHAAQSRLKKPKVKMPEVKPKYVPKEFDNLPVSEADDARRKKFNLELQDHIKKNIEKKYGPKQSPKQYERIEDYLANKVWNR